MAVSKKNKIKNSIIAQLESMGATQPHFIDLVDHYMGMYETREKLQKDIDTRGVSFLDSSSAGHEMWKNNPSVAELNRVSAQMLKILNALRVRVDLVQEADDDEM